MATPANPIEAISGRLRETSALTLLIEQRSYPSKPTHDAPLPYVVFYRQSGGDGMNLNGRRQLRQHDVRVDVYAKSQEQANAVLSAVVDQLDGWQEKPIGVQGCFAQGDADEETPGDEIQLSGQTFSLWFKPQS